MELNAGKSSITSHFLREEERCEFVRIFPYNSVGLDDGLIYLGFHLKSNDYRKHDWSWLLEKCLRVWCHKWLSRAGRLTLVKSVLEAVPVYWLSLSWIPKGILEAARRIYFRFLWSGK